MAERVRFELTGRCYPDGTLAVCWHSPLAHRSFTGVYSSKSKRAQGPLTWFEARAWRLVVVAVALIRAVRTVAVFTSRTLGTFRTLWANRALWTFWTSRPLGTSGALWASRTGR